MRALIPSPCTLRYLRYLVWTPSHPSARSITTTSTLRSGHSKWATTKHDKARADARKNKARNVYTRDIINSVRLYGADLKYNGKLETAISNAQKTGMSKASIDAAILRGQGKSASGAKLDSLLLEAIWGREKPVGMIVEAETESKATTLQELRLMIKQGGGNQAPTQFLFERRGRVTLSAHKGLDADGVMEALLDESGVVDVWTDDQGRIVVDTEPDAVKAIESKVLDSLRLAAQRVETVWHPNQDTIVHDLDESQSEDMDKLVDKLEDLPGVQKVWTNLAT